MHPLSIQISTRDSRAHRELQRTYTLETRHPRWELLKVFLNALFTMRFR